MERNLDGIPAYLDMYIRLTPEELEALAKGETIYVVCEGWRIELDPPGKGD